MHKTIPLLFALSLLGACANMSEYEKQVEDYEPVYCYRSIGAVQCFDKPNHRDEKRLVNYFGPAPHRYDRPQPVEEFTNHQAPPSVGYWVKDPEPVPQPSHAYQRETMPWRTEAPTPMAPEIKAEAPVAPKVIYREPATDLEAE